MGIKHFINSQDFSRGEYDAILKRAEEFVSAGIPPTLLEGKIAATLFFQPSTRTMSSFQSALIRAGGGWIGVRGEKGLSMEKGEDFDDTIRTYSDFSDVIVLRHPSETSAHDAARVSRVPVINGGSGTREHAVWAVMLLFNMYHYFNGKLDGKRVGIYGVTGVNRVCKALVPVLGYYGMSIAVDDLGHFPFSEEVVSSAKKKGLAQLSYNTLDDFISEVDYLLVPHALQTGIQSSDEVLKKQQEVISKKFKPITKEHMKKLRKDAFLDMVAPRMFEVERDVDSDPRAIFTKKAIHTHAAVALVEHVLK